MRRSCRWTDINLHFTGDIHAMSAAHNLLAAIVDNHIYWGDAPALDPRRVTWPRVLDMNDRALRDLVIGLGGTAGGMPRESRFDIATASEVMAILCLSRDLADLQRRLGDIVVGETFDKRIVRAAELQRGRGDGGAAAATRSSRTWCRRWRTIRCSCMAGRSPISRMAATPCWRRRRR